MTEQLTPCEQLTFPERRKHISQHVNVCHSYIFLPLGSYPNITRNEHIEGYQ